MKAKEMVLAILVSAVGTMMVGNASATTTSDDTMVHSRSSDECYAALTRDWSKLAQLRGKENQSSEPVVIVTQAEGTRKD